MPTENAADALSKNAPVAKRAGKVPKFMEPILPIFNFLQQNVCRLIPGYKGGLDQKKEEASGV
jgi:hypothetical protein